MPYSKQCVECGKPFDSLQPHAKSCSSKCRRNLHVRVYGRHSELGISTGTVGAISELIASSDLMKKGYSVFRALSPACFADVVAIRGGKQYSFEVRTGYIGENGTVSFPKKLSQDKNGSVDYFAVVIIPLNQVRYFTTSIEEVDLTPLGRE